MKSILGILIVILSIKASAQHQEPTEMDMAMFDRLEKTCQQEAEIAAEKAVQDAINIPGSQGGNISSAFVEGLKKDKKSFIRLYAASCHVEGIKKFKVVTPYGFGQ